jgi:hypothetical protein
MINERRNFFRIDVDVLITHLPIDQSSALAHRIPAPFLQEPSYSLMREIQAIDQDSHRYLHAVGEYNRELELYLRSINKKIDVISAHIAQNLSPELEQQAQRISLSEGGLSFHCPQPMAHDNYLAIQLSLLPAHQSLIMFAKIINCSPAPTGGFLVALSFVEPQDSDCQIISRHIMQQQQAQRREERMN